MGERPSYLELLRNSSFGALWSSQLVSVSGDAIFDVALLWLVLVTTGSPALVGLTQAMVVLPSVFAGPIAGVYADRHNRRDILIVSNLAQGAITAVLSLLYVEHVLAFPYLLFLVLLLYTGAAFFQSSLNAMISSIVDRPNLSAANGLMWLTNSANQLAGYTVGGVVLVTIGASGSITYDSLTFFVAAAILIAVARSYGQVRRNSSSPDPPRESFRKRFQEGLDYVKHSRLFLQLIVFGLIVNFLAGGFIAILAPYVRTQLLGNALEYGLALSCFALGGISGNLLVGKLNSRSYVGKLLLFGVASFGGLLAVAGLVTELPLAAVILFGMGTLEASVNIPVSVLVQTKVPNELLGRVGTVLRSFLTAALPAGSVIFGWLAGVASPGSILLEVGLAMFTASLILYIPFNELRSASY